MTKHVQRITRLANIQFGIAAVIALTVLGFVVYPAYADITDGNARLSELADSIAGFEKNLGEKRDTYRELKDNYVLTAANQRELSRAILPTDLDQTDIVRSIEGFTSKISDSHNLVTLKGINFGRPVVQKEVDYVTLPFKVTVNTTREKFKEILRFFERSGTFLQPGEEANRRLLDVREVAIQVNDLAVLQAQNEAGSVDIDISAQGYSLPDTGGNKTPAANK